MIENMIISAAEEELDWLCFTAEQANSKVTLVLGTGTPYDCEFEYSTDGSTWQPYVVGTTGAITLASVDDKVYFRGDNEAISVDINNYYKFTMSGKIAASGSVMTLLSTTNPNPPMNPGCFAGLFMGCAAMTTAPELPAKTLSQNCYQYMFNACTGLTEAPDLPATVIANACYNNMFNACTGLTEAPDLPGTRLINNCYTNMFYRCSNLASIKTAYTGAFSTTCFNNWVNGVAASGDFYYNGSDTTTGTYAIPSGWTVHTF